MHTDYLNIFTYIFTNPWTFEHLVFGICPEPGRLKSIRPRIYDSSDFAIAIVQSETRLCSYRERPRRVSASTTDWKALAKLHSRGSRVARRRLRWESGCTCHARRASVRVATLLSLLSFSPPSLSVPRLFSYSICKSRSVRKVTPDRANFVF